MNTFLPGLGNGLQAKTLIRPDNCAKCKWHAAVAGQPHLECRRNPPTAALVPTNQGMQTVCVFPIVRSDLWCGQFSPSITGVN